MAEQSTALHKEGRGNRTRRHARQNSGGVVNDEEVLQGWIEANTRKRAAVRSLVEPPHACSDALSVCQSTPESTQQTRQGRPAHQADDDCLTTGSTSQLPHTRRQEELTPATTPPGRPGSTGP